MQFPLNLELLSLVMPMLFCQAVYGYSPWYQYGSHQTKAIDIEGFPVRKSIDCISDFVSL